MKKLFERMKSYSFWVSFSGALIIFLNCLGNIFHFQIQNEVVEDVIMSIAGLLVVLGFVTKETGDDNEENADDEMQENETSDDNALENENLENESEESKENLPNENETKNAESETKNTENEDDKIE